MDFVNLYRENKKIIPGPIIKMIANVSNKIGLVDAIVLKRIEQFYKNTNIIKKGDLVFDVGANKGEFSQMFLKCGAKVIAFEPQPKHVKSMRKRFEGKNFEVIQAGIGEKEGTLTLYLCEKDCASTFSKEHIEISNEVYDKKFEGTIESPITTLDKMIDKYGIPAYCKIDVEGFELNVLKGLNKTINMISMEVHVNDLDEIKRCIELLENSKKREYNYTDWISEKFSLETWVESEELIRRLKDESKKNSTWSGDVFSRVKE